MCIRDSDGGVALVETLSASGPWGALSLDGQVNFSESLMDLKGQLNLTSPQDAPVIPVKYSGSLNNPSTNWTSRALESFVIAGIERRIRTSLFKEQENREATTGEAANNPAGEVFSRAFGFLNNLKNCLLYTSDAADDLLCVDLGGRRIIKKKKNKNHIDERIGGYIK
eukprot:TRINITY_DN488_c0_g1_i3.p1 TRINITY_DN488_c0_g1~~TRINITY_DN488_c0_g1_i3.p1  ORF type:complete len:168 (+),score=44.99 TRINITY_DN488_c0_g1_i3:173-676(+)